MLAPAIRTGLSVPIPGNFGDGGSSSAANPNHTYAAAGNYTVTLTVTDNDGASASDSTTASVQDAQQPVCNITVNPTSLAFGNVNVGSTASRSTTVTNTGTAACALSVARTGTTEFALTSPATINVAVGATATVSATYTPSAAGADTGNLAISGSGITTVNVPLTGTGVQQQAQCNPATPSLSINSTSQDGCPEQLVPESATLLNGAFRVLAINDLGMHCGDLDTRISSILPPFQVLLGQVIQRGSHPDAEPGGREPGVLRGLQPERPDPESVECHTRPEGRRQHLQDQLLGCGCWRRL